MEGESRLDRKPIVSRLRKMRVGETIRFDIAQRDSVNNTKSRMYKEKREGRLWSMVTDVDKGIVLVTRTS